MRLLLLGLLVAPALMFSAVQLAILMMSSWVEIFEVVSKVEIEVELYGPRCIL
jgi:hypothetical protein